MSEEKGSKRHKNVPLTRSEQHKIRALIRQWKTKFGWELLVKAINSELDIEITRQSLQGYTSIKDEYNDKKAQFRGVTPEITKRVTMSDVEQLKKIEQLKAELAIKNEIIEKQLVYIKTMLANAIEIPNYDISNITKPRND
jgi:hypothetical protein